VRELPSGTVTFVFTDIEGSTRLLHELGETYADVLAEHRRVLRDAFARHGGVEVDMQGDAFFVAFARASDALEAARDIQVALSGPIRVRIGVHTGEPLLTGDGYVGIDVHRAARIAAAGHGGQVLVSQSTRDLVASNGFRDLGEHRLKDLTAPERIYQLGDGDFPPLKSLHQTNLPVQPTPLIGREREVAEVIELVRSHRLVTLTGAGGSGKTRLALQAAAELVDEFPDGVWFVSLAASTDASLVEASVASVVGAKPDSQGFLNGKRMLLLLDNLEQLLPSVAEVVSRLPVNVIATSRERLYVYAEQEYQVPTLQPNEAVALFTARSRLLKATFEPDEHVTEIARRLDGLPLALELAAARVKVLKTEQILERLGHSLDLLTSGSRDVPERQRTLRATIAWSHELLSEEEQALFVRLAVFPGSFDLEAAEAITDADVDTLASLIDKSLLRQTADGRFFMLETIREYAAERFDDVEVRRRHAKHFLALTECAKEKGRQGDMVAELRALDAEISNIRAALNLYDEHGSVEQLFQLVACLGFYWNTRGLLREADAWYAVALRKRADASPAIRAKVLVFGASAARGIGDLDRALELGLEGADASRALDDPTAVGLAYHHLGEVLFSRGEMGAAIDAFETAVAEYQLAGETGATTIGDLGEVALAEERYEDAVAYMQRALRLFTKEEESHVRSAGRVVARYNLAVALRHLGRREEARLKLREAIEGIAELEYAEGLSWCLVATSELLLDDDRSREAGALFRTAADMLRETGAILGPSEMRLCDDVTSRLDQVGPGWRDTSALDRNEAIELALATLD
jgi:predicted ATPase